MTSVAPGISEGIATLAEEVRAALDQVASPHLAEAGIEAALKRALAHDDLLPEEILRPDFGHYRQELLHVDPAGGFSIAALIWLPGHRTPVHDHRCWCCFGVWRGREIETFYRQDEEGRLVPSGRSICYAGDVEFLVPPGDIHQVSNDDMVPTVSIHIYGVDLSEAGTSIHRCYEASGGHGPCSREVIRDRTLVVVGGGFSGAMTAVHLLRGSGPETRVVLFEPTSEAGRGAAYGTRCLAHLLNVPAGGMSALPEEPNHFLEWCHRTGRTAGAGDFLPRAWYGEYLGDVLAEEASRSQARFEIRRERIDAIDREASAMHLRTSAGASLTADAVVLAIGSPPGRQQLPKPAACQNCWPPMTDPWVPGALEKVAPEDSVLIVGTGLTFMDVVAELASRHHRGRIVAISRRGLLPASHRPADPAGRFDAAVFREGLAGEQMRVSSLCSHVRRAIEQAHDANADWREVVNAIRPLTARIWAALPRQERRRFSRHLKPFWEILRHRVAPAVLETSQRLRDAGVLELARGSLSDLRLLEDGRYQAEWGHPARGANRGTFDRVINATGFSTRLASSASELLCQLHGKGWIREDELGLGIDTSSDLRLIDRDGAVLPGVYYVGPMLRARFWECTAVPELRLRAAEVAACMLANLSQPAKVR